LIPNSAIRPIKAGPRRIEIWVVKNSSWLALGIIAAAFVLRVAYSNSCYLNPDEAQHFGAARQSSWLETYKASLLVSHPPLFILVLHGILFLGRTELILRLPSVVAGTAALWLAFSWLRRSLGATSALVGLGFMAISPAAISASTEVRQYGLLLCFVCGALYATERTFTERSCLWAVIQGLFVAGALLTHYIAVVVLISLGFYILLRSFLDAVPRLVLFTIGASQLIVAMLEGWLYLGYVHRAVRFNMDYLRPHYYLKGRESLLVFAWRAVSGTFSYTFGFHRLAFLFLLVFLVGVIALLGGRTKEPRLMGLLIILPFAIGFAAAVAQVFPFDGTRHQAYLLPFLAAGFSAAFACLRRGLAVPLLMLGTVFAPLWAIHSVPDNNNRELSVRDMRAAIVYVHGMVPRGSPLFVDDETRLVLRYYLAANYASLDTSRSRTGIEEQLGGYRVVVPKKFTWAFRPNEVIEQVTDSARAMSVPAGDPLWCVSDAWQDPSLASRLPAGRYRDVKEFGRITVIKFLAQQR
jgi:4-amino-4-deoxy-L-arabinose transferase-like glycosyltransferase